MKKLLGATLLAGMMASAYAQSGVSEAIRWERAKERAAARQAEIERGGAITQSAKTQSGKTRTAQPQDAEPAKPAHTALREAISYERFKDAAASRQAQIEARNEKSQRTVTASGRK